MKIDTVSHCNRRLSFCPKSIWPDVLPAIAWEGICIAGFDRAEKAACLFVSRDENSLERMLAGIYPKLGFVELSYLAGALDDLHLDFDWRDFAAQLGYHWCDDWLPLFKIVRRAPSELTEWWRTREVSARDLAPLKALTHETQLAEWFCLATHVAKFQPSKSDGVQILEWLVDILLGSKPTRGLTDTRSFAQLKEQARAARFPMTTQNEQSQSELAAKLPWPMGTKAAWVRHGDRGGIEIKMFSKSAGDLQKQIASLQNAALEWTRCAPAIEPGGAVSESGEPT